MSGAAADYRQRQQFNRTAGFPPLHRGQDVSASPEVWFVRHAEREFNWVRGPLPEADEGVSYPLSEAGVHQAADLAASFEDVEIRAIHSSRRLRAIQTADANSTRSGITVSLAPQLVEIDFGPAPDLREIPALAQEWIGGDTEAASAGPTRCLTEQMLPCRHTRQHRANSDA